MERARYSLKLRICLAIGITLVIVAGLLTYVLKTRLLEQLKQESITQAELRGDMIVAELEKRIDYTRAVTQSMASFAEQNTADQQQYRKVLPSLLSPAGSQNLLAGGGYWPEPFKFDAKQERHSFFWGRDEHGKLIYFDDYNLPENKSYHDEAWYFPTKLMPPGRCYWSESYVDPYSKEPMVTCSCPVYKAGEFTGITTVDMRLKGIEAFFSLLTQHFDGYIIALDQNNQIIALPNIKGQQQRQRILSKATPLFRPLEQAIDEINDEIRAHANLHPDFAASKELLSREVTAVQPWVINSILDPEHDKHHAHLLGRIDIDYDPVLDQAVSASIFHVPQTYWKIVVVKAQSQIYQNAQQIVNELMLVASVLVGIVSISAFYMLGLLVFKPIKTIALALRQTSESPDSLVSIPEVNGREFGQLVYWYNKRTEALRDSLKLLGKANIELNKQAKYDPLTELANRRSFEYALQELLDKDAWDDFALLYIDLDQFKIINDTCGHLAGDQLLVEVSQILHKAMRPNDSVYRLGGDEFTALTRCSDQEQVMVLAERLRNDIEHYIFVWEGKIFSITASIGVLVLNSIEKNISDAMKFVDTACYAAKDAGRNSVYLYSADDNEINIRRGEMKWVSKIQAAIEANNFSIAFQVIEPIQKQSNNKYGIEALIRLNYKGQIIPPSAFLPAAERYGQIFKIDKWMIHQVFAILSEDERFLNHFDYCSINLSADFLSTDGSIAYIRKKLYEFRIPSSKICFEVTETQVMKNTQAAKSFLEDLKSIGCRVALDDFGAGMSSYGYLHKFPIDILKIDSQFIRQIDSNKIDYAIVHSIQDMAKTIGLLTVAEYVQTQPALERVREIGVDYAQGYLLCEPQPFETLMQSICRHELTQQQTTNNN